MRGARGLIILGLLIALGAEAQPRVQPQPQPQPQRVEQRAVAPMQGHSFSGWDVERFAPSKSVSACERWAGKEFIGSRRGKASYCWQGCTVQRGALDGNTARYKLTGSSCES